MDSVSADLRQAFRVLIKSPGFTAIALTTLTLGIGANIAIFSVVNTVILQPLPYPHPERIMKLGRSFGADTSYSTSIPRFMAWRNNDVFEAVAAYDQSGPGLNLGGSGHPEQFKGIHVSAGYFRVFGVAPIRGRAFLPAEDAPGGERVAILSGKLLASRFNGDPQMVGRSLVLNGDAYTVVGILPVGFTPDPPADIFLPLQADPNSANQGNYLSVAARLKPDVPIETARAQMKITSERFRATYPKFMDKNEGIAVIPMREALVGDVRTALLVLAGAVGLVLLIACANVANLLLARAAGRQRELAIRAAIGASRWRVMRQLLTESLLLAGVGGALGFLLGIWGVGMLLQLVPGNIPRLPDPAEAHATFSHMDWRIAAFAIGLSLLTGILFGVFPALKISNPDLSLTLREASSRSGTGLKQNHARAVLVITEVALALVLLVGSALLIRTFIGLRSVNPGFDGHNVITMQTSMAGGRYATTAKVANFTSQVLRRIEALPGVEAAATSTVLPIEGAVDLPFTIAGRPLSDGNLFAAEEQWRYISPHYFATFKIPLLRGRTFNENDVENSSRVVIVNQTMAKKYWPKQDPIGQVITIGKGLGPEFEEPPRQIVGIVATAKERGLGNGDVGVMYIPQNQVAQGITTLANSALPLCWAVKTTMDPITLKAAIEREFLAVDSAMPVARVRTMDQVMSEGVSRQNFNMLLLSIFAGIALLLAAIGIYGLISYSVEQRMQEIGIRMALGAGRQDMLRLVIGQGMKLTLIGVVFGLGIAYGLSRLLASLLFGVKASDPATFALVAAVLTSVALLASFIPARRATKVDPIIALRYE